MGHLGNILVLICRKVKTLRGKISTNKKKKEGEKLKIKVKGEKVRVKRIRWSQELLNVLVKIFKYSQILTFENL